MHGWVGGVGCVCGWACGRRCEWMPVWWVFRKKYGCVWTEAAFKLSLEQQSKSFPFRPQFPYLSEQSSADQSESRITK